MTRRPAIERAMLGASPALGFAPRAGPSESLPREEE